ncbi:TonB-dependent receptor domain-containing protein [Sphingomonas sp. FW199]|uniref:TonB-dependent receptor domain-containing protein n=1 Tax=Sphingomonas sp. FW199 TaxID=3400217 RepID=UPI003CF12ADC
MLGHFEFSPAFDFFFEAKYARSDSIGNQLGPTFLNNTTASLGNDTRINMRLDNPFLNPADRATLTNELLTSGCGFGNGLGVAAATCQPLTAAQRTAIVNGTYRFQFARTLSDSPDRDEVFRRETYRAVAGFRGTFNEDWSYEIAANYGRMEESARMLGFVDRQRFLLSLDAGLNPATNTIQCRSQFDAAAAVGLAAGLSGSAATPQKLAADIAACQPYNPFGAGNNQAAVDYFKADILNTARLEQLNFVGYLSGDLSQLFELPGGPVRFVVGAEYRRDKASNNSDADSETGLTNSVFLGDVNAPAQEVKEAFGELQVPLLKDIFLFKDLTLSGAIRVSDYNNAAGTILSYNGSVEWTPVDGLRLRGNYGRAVRAPNVSETGFPAVPNFANGFIDPCNANAIGNNPNRSSACQAELTDAQRANLPLAGYSLGIISGSNANLTEETADTYTVGAVFTPRFLPGFSLSADYYDITVDNVIVSLAAQTIVNACYDTPGGSPLCNGFQRNLTGANGPFGELPGQILVNTLVSGPQNFARRVRRGIDFEVAYRSEIASDITLSSRLLYTHVLQSSNFQDPTRPNFENRILSEVGDPQDEFRWDVDLSFSNVTFGYQMRYIGPQLLTTYENVFTLNNEPPLNLDAFDQLEYPGVVYHDVRFDFAINKGSDKNDYNLFLGIDNLTNLNPPFGTTATGAGTAIYNIRGRNFYAGFRAKF